MVCKATRALRGGRARPERDRDRCGLAVAQDLEGHGLTRGVRAEDQVERVARVELCPIDRGDDVTGLEGLLDAVAPDDSRLAEVDP
jgi:hypothetical protein